MTPPGASSGLRYWGNLDGRTGGSLWTVNLFGMQPWDQAPGHVRLPLPVPRGTARRMEGEDRRGRMGEVWAEGQAEDRIEQSRRDDKQNESETWEGKGWSGVEWMGSGGTRELNPRSQR